MVILAMAGGGKNRVGNLWPVEVWAGVVSLASSRIDRVRMPSGAQIKSVVCNYDAKRSIMLKDGTLEFKSDFTSGDE